MILSCKTVTFVFIFYSSENLSVYSHISPGELKRVPMERPCVAAGGLKTGGELWSRH